MNKAKVAVIYTRVSSRKQVEEGHGSESQESSCRNYAKTFGWKVLTTFHEKAVSGAADYRPALQEMIDFLKKQKEDIIVLMDDVSRLARDHIKYGLFKQQIERAGAKIDFVTMNFDETPEGNYVETIIAATAELERKQNARRTKSRMTARAEAGYHVSRSPLGYQYSKDRLHGKLLVKKEPEAELVTKALEGYANQHLETQYDVQAFLFKTLGRKYSYNSIVNILTRKVYAGIIDIPTLGVYAKGKHKPLISIETFERIQKRLQSKRQVLRTKRLSTFPLKSSVLCNACKRRYTGSVSKGRSNYYAYYHCANKYCSERGKTTSKKVLEDQFVELLEEMKVSPGTFDMVFEMLDDLKIEFETKMREGAKHRTKEIQDIERQIHNGISRLLECEDLNFQLRIQQKLKELEKRKLILGEMDVSPDTIEMKFRTSMRDLKEVFESPAEHWLQADEKGKRLFPKLIFNGDLVYARNEGFRTARKSLPLKVLHKAEKGSLSMVELSEIILNQPK